jgi:hypothetical protein
MQGSSGAAKENLTDSGAGCDHRRGVRQVIGIQTTDVRKRCCTFTILAVAINAAITMAEVLRQRCECPSERSNLAMPCQGHSHKRTF